MQTIKKFIHYYGPYKAVFFLDLLCAAFISLADLAYPQILRTATNTLFTRDSAVILRALPLIALGLFAMYLVQSLCKYYVSYQGHMMGAHMERDMRQQLFDHYEKLSFSYYSQNNSGHMMSKLVSELFDIAEFAHRIRWRVSGWCSLLPMKTLSGRNLRRATMHFFFPNGIIITVWEVLWAGICFFRV